MDLTNNIKNNFNRGFFNKAMIIEGLPDDYPAWTIKGNYEVSVAVPCDNTEAFSEQFSSVKIKLHTNVEINGTTYNILMLTCSDMNLRNEFALICSQFAAPGKSRKELTDNPEQWWKRWKTLLGNKNADKDTYSLLGELSVVEYLLKHDKKPVWSGINGGVHDIETEHECYEVKSTIDRYRYEVTISSIYQMNKSCEKLNLVYCRFEPSSVGRSLDDLIRSVVSSGISEEEIEKHMSDIGFEKGCIARAKKYKLLEMKSYPVDDKFPSITEQSFKGEKLPDNVLKFTYTIDLSGIDSTNLIGTGADTNVQDS